MRPFLTLLITLAIVLVACPATYAASPAFEPPVVLVNDAPNRDPVPSDFSPVAATNGSGTWVVAWSSNDTLQGTIDTDSDILFSRSTDGGLTFAAPAPLNTNAANDSEYFYTSLVGVHDRVPALAAHGDRFIAVWYRAALKSDTIAVARSDDGGAHWTDLGTLYDDSFSPSIASDGAGTWVIVWRYRPTINEAADIFFTRSTDDGITWSPPTTLNAVPESLGDATPHITWLDGVWGVAWTAVVDGLSDQGRALFARSLDGLIWSAPLELNPGAPPYDSDVTIAAGGSGSWVATWSSGPTHANAMNIMTSHSSDGGITWSPAVILNTDSVTDGNDDYDPAVAAIDAATYAAVWVRANSGADGSDVLSSLSDDGGVTWSAPTSLNTGVSPNGLSIHEFHPSLTADPLGRFVALWSSDDESLASGTKGKGTEVAMALAGHSCGNGGLDVGETCDDGDRGSLDCCGRTCGFDAAGAVCAADADPCTLERCDGAGTCTHQNAPVGTPCARDADLCTHDRCDGNDVCVHVLEPHASCLAALTPKASTLKITGGDPAKRTLNWSWRHGPARVMSQLSTYLSGAPYALCVYDGTGLVVRTDLPVDASCHEHSCWKATNTTMKYADRLGTPNGAISAKLKSGSAGKTGAKVSARGANLETPALPSASLPVTAQLISDEMNACFGATFSASGVQRNLPDLFKAKSD